MSFDDLNNYYNSPEKAKENEAKENTEESKDNITDEAREYSEIVAMANEDAWAKFA